jgi:hypothetical protein
MSVTPWCVLTIGREEMSPQRLLRFHPPSTALPTRAGFDPNGARRCRLQSSARGFWDENRKSSQRTQQALGERWRYPSYREELRAILAEQRGEGAD